MSMMENRQKRAKAPRQIAPFMLTERQEKKGGEREGQVREEADKEEGRRK